MRNYHILKVEHVWCNRTDTPKVKITSERFRQSIRIPYTNEPGASNPSMSTAILYLHTQRGFELVGKGEGKDHYYLISTTFQPLKQ